MSQVTTVTMHGEPLTLQGIQPDVGDVLKDCELIGSEMKPVKLSSFKGKVCLISSVPSLDTSVCDIMTRKFAEDTVGLGDDVVFITVSMDLPFAQSRWCVASDVKGVHVLSDYKDGNFGRTFGLTIKELGLLTRAVFVVDKDGLVRYIQIVDELSHEPDYEAAIEAVKNCL